MVATALAQVLTAATIRSSSARWLQAIRRRVSGKLVGANMGKASQHEQAGFGNAAAAFRHFLQLAVTQA